MSENPVYQNIGITLTKYENEKQISKNAASIAYQSIIKELAVRGLFEQFNKKPKKMPQEIQNFFYVLFADNEINNGGFAQYFFNGYGKYAEETVKAFNEIGAPKKSAAFLSVMKSFPREKYPKTENEYSKLLDKYEDDLAFLDENIEGKYYESGERIEELMLSYVKKHYTKFSP